MQGAIICLVLREWLCIYKAVCIDIIFAIKKAAIEYIRYYIIMGCKIFWDISFSPIVLTTYNLIAIAIIIS